MRTKLILMTMAFLLVIFAWSAVAFAEEDYSFFYERLAPYGQWVQVPTYGWVWSPAQVPVGWRPYSGDGHWVNSDQGPTWVPNEEWGWITYHYGRWLYGPDVGLDYGWIWIPGTVWGPGWVAWRSNDNVIGWAPLPPDRVWDPWLFNDNVPFAFDDIGFFWWNFVDADDFFAVDLGPRIHNIRDNDRDFRLTRDHTSFRWENGRVVDRSFDEGRLARLGTGHEGVRLTDLRKETGGRTWAVKGNELSVYRPVIARRAEGKAPVTTGERGNLGAVNRDFDGFRTMREQAGGGQKGPMLMDTRHLGQPAPGGNRFEQPGPRNSGGQTMSQPAPSRQFEGRQAGGGNGGFRSAPSAGRSGGFSGGGFSHGGGSVSHGGGGRAGSGNFGR